ncbi:MAG: CRISPR-associated endonuclease Cas2 [Mycoplasmataceae bacterium]|nr:CRISPR-associated endonuclease Cas2 [Mycoplasmataceae bacterium]
MRLIVMYDLYFDDEKSIKEYTKFRRALVSRGYYMMQFSIYCKPLNTITKKEYEIRYLKKYIPSAGNIRVITITEAQYNNIALLRGGKSINESINSTERRVKISWPKSV